MSGIGLCVPDSSRGAPCFYHIHTHACVQKKTKSLPLVSSRHTPWEAPNPNQYSSVVDNLLTWYPIIWISLWNYLCSLHSSILASFSVCVSFFSNHFPSGDNIQIYRTELISGQEKCTVGLVLIPSLPCWPLLCGQLHVTMLRVQKRDLIVISLVCIFCIAIVDFCWGIYLRWLKTFCRVLKYRWKNFKFAHFGII